jgi:hypothetical protein
LARRISIQQIQLRKTDFDHQFIFAQVDILLFFPFLLFLHNIFSAFISSHCAWSDSLPKTSIFYQPDNNHLQPHYGLFEENFPKLIDAGSGLI